MTQPDPARVAARWLREQTAASRGPTPEQAVSKIKAALDPLFKDQKLWRVESQTDPLSRGQQVSIDLTRAGLELNPMNGATLAAYVPPARARGARPGELEDEFAWKQGEPPRSNQLQVAIYSSADLPFRQPKPFRGTPDKAVDYLISWFKLHANDLLWHQQGPNPIETFQQLRRGDAVIITYLTPKILPTTFKGAVANNPTNTATIRGMRGKPRQLRDTPEGVALDRDPVLRIEVVGNLVDDPKGGMAALKSRR